MIKINMGCGWRDFGPSWCHIDGGDHEHLDKDLGTVTEILIQNDKVDLIYASHLLQYFSRNEAKYVLSEWFRVLKPKGILRLSVPDFWVLCDLYSGDNPKMSVNIRAILGPLYGKMKMGTETIYHKTTYDYDSLRVLTESVGFTGMKYYNWRETEHAEFDDHSQAYLPHMDKDNGTLISLNVECYK